MIMLKIIIINKYQKHNDNNDSHYYIISTHLHCAKPFSSTLE